MASELKRGVIRIGSNYTRLLCNLLIGIAAVPIFFVGVGTEGFGLIGLLGSALGIAEMCRSIVRASMARELGSAYHSANPEDFPNAYNAALVISTALFVITIGLFAVLYAILPLLRIPDHLLGAARWLVIAKGTYSAMIVLLGPTFNMYQVSERMVLHNLWTVLDRVTDFLAAVLLFVILGMRDPASGIIAYAWLSAGSGILVLVFASALMIGIDRRLFPEPSRISRREIRKMLPTAGWNAAVVTAMNMHIRLGQLIMNLAFGLVGNTMFTIAVRLTGYVRMSVAGSTDGSAAVSARLSTSGKGISVADLTGYSTRLHAAIAAPSALLVLILAEPLILAWIGWVGRAVEDPSVIPGAVPLAKILVLGMTVRGIADSWRRILYGAGFVRRYGPAVILGGVFNPICAIALVLLLPESVAYQGPAWAYTAAMVLVNFVWMPRITAQCLGVSLREVVSPIFRPTIAAMLASVLLWTPMMLGREDSLVVLGVTIAAFSLTHAALCWFFVLSPPERDRFSHAFMRRIGLAVPAGLRG